VVRAHARDELGIDVDDLANPWQVRACVGRSEKREGLPHSYKAAAASPHLSHALCPQPAPSTPADHTPPSPRHQRRQASVTSALAFSLGAGLPLLAGAFVLDAFLRMSVVAAASTLGLLLFGALGAWLGGATLWRGALRVLLGGWLAMVLTFGIGRLFNVSAA
jgi:VIT1/CCC1 family predicted Fe2+/Mn2+ transporter